MVVTLGGSCPGGSCPGGSKVVVLDGSYPRW